MKYLGHLVARAVQGIHRAVEVMEMSSTKTPQRLDGYERADRLYAPVVRPEPTGEELVTWGEFVETRLLAEYRGAGVPMQRLRPAVLRLREEFATTYPLAHAEPLLDVAGRELVLRIQDEVGLTSRLRLVVIRNAQVILAPQSEKFVESAEYATDGRRVVQRLHPMPDLREVVFDPLRRSGRPVVRSVPTEVIAEQIRAGDSLATIAEAYELLPSQIEAAIRYELLRVAEQAA